MNQIQCVCILFFSEFPFPCSECREWQRCVAVGNTTFLTPPVDGYAKGDRDTKKNAINSNGYALCVLPMYFHLFLFRFDFFN